MHWSRGPTSCVGRKATSPPLRGRGGGPRRGRSAWHAGGWVSREPGRPHRLHLKGCRGAGTGSPSPRPWTWHLASGGANPQVLGWYRRAKATKRGGDGRRGIGAPHTTGEAGESCPRNPVEGRGRREMDPLAGKTANTPRLEPVSTLRQRIAERARHALGMAWVIFIASWTNGYATARSEAICRGAGCGRTRTSGSVGGQGQQRPWSTRPPRVVEPERLTPVPNRFIGYGDASFGEEIVDVSETHTEAVIEPHRVTDDLGWKAGIRGS